MKTTGELTERSVLIPPAGLEGDLVIPEKATAVIAFAHGSGSSRHSPRNQYVARVLQQGGLATLLFDLLTAEEERIDVQTAELRFDIALLARRLSEATAWLKKDKDTRDLLVGYFGASTGAAAALVAAAQRRGDVFAVVSRGGRPDLAGTSLPRVKASTLLIVGGEDTPVIEMNENAFRQLRMEEKTLEIVPGATHLFEEPGALEKVASLARDWLQRELRYVETR
ncbi:MAG: dienelactone hydrolase family protein [Bryobacteraceae bacterium]